MGIRFAKSIKINNFLKLNFSKSGVSATLGKKGASVNIGGKGTYLNLSPSAVGINGTGISYRQRIAGGKASKKRKKSNEKETVVNNRTSTLRKNVYEEVNDDIIINETESNTNDVVNEVQEYRADLDTALNLHKYTDDVLNKKQFQDFVEELEEGMNKELYRLSMEGDEDVVENLVSSFMNNLSLPYDVRVNYELEDDVLYVDLDLPEIEDLKSEYPVYDNGRIAYKKKKSSELKQEYARLVLSLGVFLSANYFNLSSYIDEIVISGFTSVRDNNGELVDRYLYSIRYTRDVFEKTSLSELDDLYGFILGFDNRINLSKTFTFKAIKPYETKITLRTNELIDEAVLGLKQLGYKASEIQMILPELSEYQYESSGEYLKQALRLMKEKV